MDVKPYILTEKYTGGIHYLAITELRGEAVVINQEEPLLDYRARLLVHVYYQVYPVNPTHYHTGADPGISAGGGEMWLRVVVWGGLSQAQRRVSEA